MNFNINFFPDVTILYGINGSGKTTILKIINFMINGKLDMIFSIQFSEIALKFQIENIIYFFRIKKSFKKIKERTEFSQFFTISERFDPETTKKIYISIETDYGELYNIITSYITIKNESNEFESDYFIKMRRKIQKIFNCIFMSLDRKAEFYSEEESEYTNDDIYLSFEEFVLRRTGIPFNSQSIRSINNLREEYENNIRFRNRPNVINQPYDSSALDQVKRIIEKNYMDYFRYSSNLDEEFQRESYEKLA